MCSSVKRTQHCSGGKKPLSDFRLLWQSRNKRGLKQAPVPLVYATSQVTVQCFCPEGLLREFSEILQIEQLVALATKWPLLSSEGNEDRVAFGEMHSPRLSSKGETEGLFPEPRQEQAAFWPMTQCGLPNTKWISSLSNWGPKTE